MSDLRSALRQLLRAPGFTAVAVITLALALGVNSAIFSIVNGLILRPSTTREPDRVVSVFTAKQASERDFRQFSFTEYATLRASAEPFSEVTAISFAMAGIGEGESMRRSLTFFVAENFFSFAGVRPAAGRFFSAEEGSPKAGIPVLVASHALWHKMGRSAGFVGSTLRVNGHPHTVIGVAPEGFPGISALFSPDVWLPLGMYGIAVNPFSDTKAISDLNHPENFTLNIRARMNAGLSIEAARARLPVLDAQLNALLPPQGEPRALQITEPTHLSVSTSPADEGPLELVALLLCGMAGIVLLIACLNLANLLLARGAARSREIAVRLAIGASRWQIVRQLTVEGLVLALLGGLLGLLLSDWSNAIIESSLQTLLAAVGFSLNADLQPDLRVLAATFGFCLIATLVFSVGPALHAARADLVHDLKALGGEPTSTGRLNRFFAGRHLLVMAQMALALVLVFSSGLFFRAALNASGMDLGFNPDGVAVAGIDYSLRNTTPEEGLRRLIEITDRARNQPGVQAAGLTNLLPYGNITTSSRVVRADASTTRGPDEPAPGEDPITSTVSSGYFESMGVRMLRGRDFSALEDRTRDSPPVAIIDEGLASKLFPEGDALGRQIRYTRAPSDGRPAEMTVVGIVARHRHDLYDGESGALRLFVPTGSNYSPNAFLCVRLAQDDPQAVLASLPALRRQLREVDPEIPLLQLAPYTDTLAKCMSLWMVRLAAIMFGVFGGIALMLATVGVYGVKAYTVARRTREIGIRMALGANRSDVFTLIMRQGMLQTLVATIVGLGLALLLGQAVSGLLYQVSPTDSPALITAVALLGCSAMLACWVPARRATRVNPNTALRAE